MSTGPASTRPAPLPRAIWVLGFVSLLMDVSSELVHSLLPLFLTGSLGVGVLAVGLIEGVAESTALVVKVFSGVLSDRLGRRKGLAVFGYALSAATKPAFALATGAGLVVAARFVDRVGKGIRGAPRDALLADLAPPERRGEAFGLRQSLDTVGAFGGPLLASALMVLFAGDFRAVFWVAVVPAMACVALLQAGVDDPPPPPGAPRGNPIRLDALRRLPPAYRQVVAVGAVFTLARFSEAFLVLRAGEVGVPVAAVPLVMVAMNAVYSASAFPVGRLADAMSRRALLAVGLATLVAADLVLAGIGGRGSLGALLAGVGLWGLHMGLTQGVLNAMVADAAPAELRGTAFGFFNLVCGLALLVASGVAGLLWERAGSAVTFGAGAAFAAIALLSLLALSAPRR